MGDLWRTGNFISGAAELCVLPECMGVSGFSACGGMLSALYEEGTEKKADGDADGPV